MALNLSLFAMLVFFTMPYPPVCVLFLFLAFCYVCGEVLLYVVSLLKEVIRNGS